MVAVVKAKVDTTLYLGQQHNQLLITQVQYLGHLAPLAVIPLG
jgi:hypothetical protein